jgi:hypothetical protein
MRILLSFVFLMVFLGKLSADYCYSYFEKKGGFTYERFFKVKPKKGIFVSKDKLLPSWRDPEAKWYCTRHKQNFREWQDFKDHIKFYHPKPTTNQYR